MAIIVYFTVFVVGGLLYWSAQNRIIGEVDESLPSGEQLRHSLLSRTGLASGEMFRAWRTHKRFFPDSHTRFLYVASFVFTALWMFFGLSLLQLLGIPQ